MCSKGTSELEPQNIQGFSLVVSDRELQEGLRFECAMFFFLMVCLLKGEWMWSDVVQQFCLFRLLKHHDACVWVGFGQHDQSLLCFGGESSCSQIVEVFWCGGEVEPSCSKLVRVFKS